MSDQDHEIVDCPACNTKGIVWQDGQLICEACDGEGHLTPDELGRQAEIVAEFPGVGLKELDPGVVELARFEEAVSEPAEPAEHRPLDEPLSDEDEETKRELFAIPRAEQDMLRRCGSDLYHLYRSGQISRAEAEQVASQSP